jgi:hypothetical protein
LLLAQFLLLPFSVQSACGGHALQVMLRTKHLGLFRSQNLSLRSRTYEPYRLFFMAASCFANGYVGELCRHGTGRRTFTHLFSACPVGEGW